jgi:hypothetical protein
MYLSQEDAPAGRPPIWIVIGVAICVLIVIVWIIGAAW